MEKKFWKKGNLFSEENFLTYFSPRIECDKLQGTSNKGSMGSLIKNVDDKDHFTLYVVENRKFWKKKFDLSSEEQILSYFSRNIECDKTHVAT